MSHSHIDVRHIANLARLELSEEEVSTFQPQIEAILQHAESLARLDAESGESAAQAPSRFGRMRDDIVHESLPPQALLQNAPDQAQGQIRVPKVVADA